MLPSPSTSLERRVTLGSYGFCLNAFALKNETPMVVSSALILYFLFLNLVAAYSRLALQIVVRRGVLYGYGHLRSHKWFVSRIRTHKTTGCFYGKASHFKQSEDLPYSLLPFCIDFHQDGQNQNFS